MPRHPKRQTSDASRPRWFLPSGAFFISLPYPTMPKPTTSPSPAHTPGPWRLMNHNEICADNEHESYIADVFDETDNWRANARLIAAAPELLDACKMNLQDAKDALTGEWQPTPEGWKSIIDHLTMVIDKAQGGE
jgi:hypothetical protein